MITPLSSSLTRALVLRRRSRIAPQTSSAAANSTIHWDRDGSGMDILESVSRHPT